MQNQYLFICSIYHRKGTKTNKPVEFARLALKSFVFLLCSGVPLYVKPRESKFWTMEIFKTLREHKGGDKDLCDKAG